MDNVEMESRIIEILSEVKEIKTIVSERDKRYDETCKSVSNQFQNVCPVKETRLRLVEDKTKKLWVLLWFVSTCLITGFIHHIYTEGKDIKPVQTQSQTQSIQMAKGNN